MNENEGNQLVFKIKDALENIVKTMKPNGAIIVALKDKVIFEQFCGFADIEKRIPTSFQTQYLIGSITKQFTAAALLNALYLKVKETSIHEKEWSEKVQAALQKTVVHYLPKGHEIWDHSIPEWANVVTLHQLLVHSSGIRNYTSLPDFEKQKSPMASQLVNFFKNYPLEFVPGTKFSYNNSGYFLLGIIVQSITNQPLDTYMHDTFFSPLGMNSTFLATWGTTPELKQTDSRFSNLAYGYTLDLANSNPKITEVNNYALMQMPGGAGSLISTPHDLLKFNNALFSGKIIPNFLLERMLFPHIQTENPNEYYGYGFEIKKSNIYGYVTHRGGIPGYHSLLTFVPNLMISIVILDNVFGNRDSLKSEIEEIKSSLPRTLTEGEKAQKIDEILEEKFPNIIENKKRFELTSLEDYIMTFLLQS